VTEKKLFVSSWYEVTTPFGTSEPRHEYIEATDQDLKELGWIRAEPTNCRKCEHFSCNCYEEDGESFIEDIECEEGNLNIAGTEEGISESKQPNVVCLDFKPKSSGKQVSERFPRCSESEPAQKKVKEPKP